MVKPKEEQTTKERNTQRRKRKRGWLQKSYLLWKICDFELAACLRNPDSGQVTFFQSADGVSLPRSIEDLVSRWTSSFAALGMLNLAQKSAHPHAEILLPKDFEQSGRRGNARAKPRSSARLNQRSNKGTRHNAKNKKTAVRRGTRVVRHNPPLPDPPLFGIPKRSDKENTAALGQIEWDQSEMAFLDEVDL